MSLSTPASLAIHQFRVGKYTCTLRVPVPQDGSIAGLNAEWSPGVPTRLSSADLRQWRRGRNEALAQVAARLGGPVVVLEA